jgi:hypothetical protein
VEPVLAQQELPKAIIDFMRERPQTFSAMDELVAMANLGCAEGGIKDSSGWAGFCAYVQSINSRQFRAELKGRTTGLNAELDSLARKFCKHMTKASPTSPKE